MRPDISAVTENYGICFPEVPLTIEQRHVLGRAIKSLPLPGELSASHLRNMTDIKTGRWIPGIQYEAGVSGWEVHVNEFDGQPSLIAPIDWYSTQFRRIGEEDILPHFLQYNGGNSATQYHWQSEVTFMDPPLQYNLPAVDVLQRSGTWLKTRFQLEEDGVYRPTRVAVDLEYDSNGLTASMAREQVGQRHRIVFNPSEMTYASANGRNNGEGPYRLNEGYTVVRRGRSSDTYRNPSLVHLFTEPGPDGINIRINPDSNLWQTEFFIPNGVIIPDYPGKIYDINREGLDYWVDQHRSMI